MSVYEVNEIGGDVGGGARVFRPQDHEDGMGLVSAFTEFCASFEYAYRALGRRPPRTSKQRRKEKGGWTPINSIYSWEDLLTETSKSGSRMSQQMTSDRT